MLTLFIVAFVIDICMLDMLLCRDSCTMFVLLVMLLRFFVVIKEMILYSLYSKCLAVRSFIFFVLNVSYKLHMVAHCLSVCVFDRKEPVLTFLFLEHIPEHFNSKVSVCF